MKAILWTIAVLVVILVVSWYILKFAVHVFLGALVILILAGIVVAVSGWFRGRSSSG